MDPKKLMVGDWVIRKNIPQEPMQIEKVDNLKGLAIASLDGIGVTERTEVLEPIPLTPEILEKNGFERKQKTFEYFEYKENGLDIEIEYFESCICTDIEYSVPGAWGYNTLHSITIENVHELQHALMVCEIDKEIIV